MPDMQDAMCTDVYNEKTQKPHFHQQHHIFSLKDHVLHFVASLLMMYSLHITAHKCVFLITYLVPINMMSFYVCHVIAVWCSRTCRLH